MRVMKTTGKMLKVGEQTFVDNGFNHFDLRRTTVILIIRSGVFPDCTDINWKFNKNNNQ